MNLILVFGMCVSKTVLFSLCMFTVSKVWPMVRATVTVRTVGVILLNPMAIVLLMLCSHTLA